MQDLRPENPPSSRRPHLRSYEDPEHPIFGRIKNIPGISNTELFLILQALIPCSQEPDRIEDLGMTFGKDVHDYLELVIRNANNPVEGRSRFRGVESSGHPGRAMPALCDSTPTWR